MTPFTDPSAHLALLFISFVCLGLWVGSYQVQAGRWRFELFAIDFALGAFLFSIVAALVLGNYGTDLPFSDRLLVSSKTSQVMSFVAGLIFGVCNTLLLGAVSLLGIAGAFAVGGGFALAIGIALNHAALPQTVLLVAIGLFIVVSLLAIFACRLAETPAPSTKGQPLGPIQLRRSTKGILVAVLGGVGIALSYPLARRGAFEEFGLGPYAGLFIFCTGVLVINLVFSLYFFNIALEGGALKLVSYLRDWPGKHLPGIIGGALWSAGALAALLAQTGSVADVTAASNSYLPLCSIPLSIILGIILWRNFTKAPRGATLLIVVALLALLGGIGILAFA